MGNGKDKQLQDRVIRFVVAPDSFKGSLSANQVGQVIKKALTQEIPQAAIDVVPMADGGEGTVESFLFATDGQRIELEVTGPTGDHIPVFYGLLGDDETVVMEVAAIAGLTLVPENKRNPFRLTTYGIGECILNALDRGYRRFIIGLGGSATNDGGLGMLQALGVTFRDADGREVTPFAASLSAVRTVDYSTIDTRIWEADIRVASDVDNPLCGPKGASYVFGPQKGATPEQVKQLDHSLAIYADAVEDHLQRTLRHTPGAGAAGGFGFGLLTIGASLESGAALVAEAAGLERRLEQADWVITGEGKTDSQTLHGKVPFYVAKLAKKHHVPSILISGSLGDDIEPLYAYFDSMHAIPNGAMALEQCMTKATMLLTQKTRNIARLLNMIQTQKS